MSEDDIENPEDQENQDDIEDLDDVLDDFEDEDDIEDTDADEDTDTDDASEETDSSKDIVPMDVDTLSEEMVRQEYQSALQGYGQSAELSQYLTYLWMLYANSHIMLVSPYIESKVPAVFIPPAYDETLRTDENVYTILDHGYAFSTSRGEDATAGSTAMGKLYNTIQKMVRLIFERVKEQSGGAGSAGNLADTEIKIALFGHELGRRKAFALIMDQENVNVNIVNFDPVAWGEQFINNLKYMIESGHGAPADLKNVAERLAPGA